MDISPGVGEEHRAVDPADVPPIPRLASLRPTAEVHEGYGLCPSKSSVPLESLLESLRVPLRLVVEQPLEQEAEPCPAHSMRMAPYGALQFDTVDRKIHWPSILLYLLEP